MFYISMSIKRIFLVILYGYLMPDCQKFCDSPQTKALTRYHKVLLGDSCRCKNLLNSLILAPTGPFALERQTILWASEHTNQQTDRQTAMRTDKHTDGQTNSHANGQTDRRTDKQPCERTNRKTDRQS